MSPGLGAGLRWPLAALRLNHTRFQFPMLPLLPLILLVSRSLEAVFMPLLTAKGVKLRIAYQKRPALLRVERFA